MEQSIFSISQLGFLIIIGFFVLITEIRTRYNYGTGTFRIPDPGKWNVFANDLLFWAAVSGWVVLGGGWFFWPELPQNFMPMATEPVVIVQVAGLLIGLAGVLYILFGILSLAESFRTSIDYEEDVNLKTDGIYRFGRNPMALGLILQGWALLLLQQTWAALLVALLLHISNLRRVHFEETFLQERFGEQYHAFCQRTGRFFPYNFSSKQVKRSRPS